MSALFRGRRGQRPLPRALTQASIQVRTIRLPKHLFAAAGL